MMFNEDDHTKVVVLDEIHKFVVQMFFVWDSFDAEISFARFIELLF